MPERITSTRNQVVGDAARLHRRRRRVETGLTLLEGPGVVGAALDAGVPIRTLFVASEEPSSVGFVEHESVERAYEVSQPVLEKVAGSRHPRGPVAVIAVPEAPSIRAADTVVCVGVADPGNVGTIIRSAAGFGFDVAVGDGSADVWSPKVIRAAAGAHFSTRIVQLGSEISPALTKAGLRTVASVSRGGDAPQFVGSHPMAVLIGNEAAGLDDALVEAADIRVTLPTSNVESLNAAVAASILMYIRSTQRPT